MENNLKECPFCGGEAEIYSATERGPDVDGVLQGHWVADCSRCDANIEFCSSPEDARSKWNTRSAPQHLIAFGNS